jgi:hypothetical protein
MLPVIAGNPPADAAQTSGMKGMMVAIPTNVAQAPSAPRTASLLSQNLALVARPRTSPYEEDWFASDTPSMPGLATFSAGPAILTERSARSWPTSR